MNGNMWKWMVSIIAVVVIALGIWWLGGMSKTSPTPTTNNETQATTTSETSGAGAVVVQNSPGTVADIIADVQNTGRFSQLLTQTGVRSTLTGKGPYTVFVATDAAFGRLIPGTVNSLSPAELKRLVQYHVVSGRKLDVDAISSGNIQALSKDMLNFQVNADNKVYVNSGYVLAAYQATNGIVYVINSVLLPPKSIQ